MANTERIRPPWWLKYVNKVMIALNKTGLFKDGPVVLTVTG
ncbi:deazaflavin-dependent nitroreductase, partial [Mycobacterium sp. ITM-2017-0098]